MLQPLSIKSKLGLGLLLSYTSYEVYMQVRTQYIIKARKEEYKNLENGTDMIYLN